MSQTASSLASADVAPPINPLHLVGYGAALAVMVAAILSGVPWFLNFVHVMAGVLWTGIDLFMGFFVGPALRAAPFEARRAVIVRLMPKTLFLMPTLSIITGTSGWFHAKQLGFLEVPWPQYGWVLAALVIITILTVQGLGVLLPTNVRVYLELRKSNPDQARIAKLMKTYIYWVTVQGCMQVAIIVVMAKFVTGL
jgi:uncharacterized membrane protein